MLQRGDPWAYGREILSKTVIFKMCINLMSITLTKDSQTRSIKDSNNQYVYYTSITQVWLTEFQN